MIFLVPKHMRRIFAYVTAVVSIAFAATSASAVDLTVPNFSFEELDLPDGTRNNIADVGSATTIPGWTTELIGSSSASFGTWNPQNSSFRESTGPDPGGSLFLTTTPAYPPGSWGEGLQAAQIQISGTLSSATIISNSLGLIASNTEYRLSLGIGIPYDFSAPHDVFAAFLSGGKFIDMIPFRGYSLQQGKFTRIEFFFRSGDFTDPRVGESLAIRLGASQGLAGGGGVVAFDAVRVTATLLPVPEPSTGALLAAALLCCGSARRKAFTDSGLSSRAFG